MFKTYTPQQVVKAQSGDECAGAVPEARNQPAQTMVEGDASRSKPQSRTRGQVRKHRASESRHSSFSTQYDYSPVPSGM